MPKKAAFSPWRGSIKGRPKKSLKAKSRKAWTAKGDIAPPAGFMPLTRKLTYLADKPYFIRRRVIFTSAGGGTQLIGMTAANTNAAGFITFSLNQIPSAGDFTALFDQYAFVSVKVTAYPQFSLNTDIGGAGFSTAMLSLFAWAVDTDTATAAPASMAAMLEYEDAKIKRTDQIIALKFQPKPQIVVGAGGGGGGLAVADEGYNWIDCDSPAVPHSGIAWYLPAPSSGAANVVRYDCIVEYNLAFRLPK